MESSGGPLLPHGEGPAVSAKKLRRVMRDVYLSLVEKHQPKVAALGVHLHRLLSSKRQRGEHLAPLTLSCRSMDPAAAVVHPLPRDHGGGGRHRRKSSSSSSGRASSLYSSLSCRSVDPAAAAYLQYRPREVQFSFKSSTTPLHKRRRSRRLLHHHHGGGDDQGLRRRRNDDRPSQPESCHGSGAAAVTRLFELLDVEDEDEGVTANKATDTVVDYLSDDDDGGDLDPETATAWPALLLSSAGPAPRQVRITDSPFPVTDAPEGDRLMVDRRADEFIAWFHEQLRTQQQRAT